MGFYVLSESTEAASGPRGELMSGKTQPPSLAVLGLIKDSDIIKNGTETDSKKKKKKRPDKDSTSRIRSVN